jgi:cytochrome c
MKRRLTLAALALALSSNVIAADGKVLFAEKTCAACHGVTGNKPILPDYPKIAGQNVKYVAKQMADIKSGARANGNSAAMQGVMHLVSDDEIKVLADYVSKLKP